MMLKPAMIKRDASYYGYGGDIIEVHSGKTAVRVVNSTQFNEPYFTAEQYAGFIKQEYSRLVESGAIQLSNNGE